MKLDREMIVQEALALLDAEGLAGLNMRTLARRLDAQGSALYWHVRDKAELLSLVAEGFYARAYAAVPAGLAWRAWLAAFGHAFRRELLAHRDSAQLCAMARPTEPDAAVAADRTAAPLVAAGLSRPVALSYQASVISLALGSAAYEQSAAMHDYLAGMISFDAAFATGLAAMVKGFP